MKIIKCSNFRCNKQFNRKSINLYSGFSCPNCGFDKYKTLDVELPNKKKDQIKFIKKYGSEL